MKKPPRVRGYQRTVVDGITFASKREAKRYGELKLMVRAGAITELNRQVPVYLWGRNGIIKTPTGRHMKYVADFVYYADGKRIIEDAKGHRTDTYRIKKAIIEAMGLTITEV